MVAHRHLHIVPDSPESETASGTNPNFLDQESNERIVAGIARIALDHVPYSGSFDGEPDLLRAHLTEIGQWRLLTQAEEVTHGLKIKAAQKAEAEVEAGVYNDGFIGPVEFTEHQAERAISEGKIASAIMITCNLRLVAKISGQSNHRNRGLSRLELIQEGYFGLMKAVENFDPDKGLKFSTFATPHILGAMKRGREDKGSTIRIPRHKQEQILAMRIAAEKLRNSLGRNPTTDEIAAKIETTTDETAKIRLDDLIMYSTALDITRRSEGDEYEYEADAHLADATAQTSMKNMINRIANQRIVDLLLPKLSEKHLRYVQLRYGLLDGNERTQVEVGKIMGFSRANASLIEKKVLALFRDILSFTSVAEDIV